MLTHWIQLRQGELSLKIESFPLQKLFDLIARGRKSFQMKGVDLQVAPTDAVVKADTALTLFMLNTLADNARKFTPRGGKVQVSASQSDQYVEIAVEDTGEGIEEKLLPSIFERFATGASSGSGLGLSICYELIQQMGGTINIKSKVGKGTTVWFSIPCKATEVVRNKK